MKLPEPEWITEEQLIECFDDALDQHEEIKVGYLTFYPSQVLKECDPIAYKLGLGDYADMIAQDGTFVEGWTDPKDYGYEDLP